VHVQWLSNMETVFSDVILLTSKSKEDFLLAISEPKWKQENAQQIPLKCRDAQTKSYQTIQHIYGPSNTTAKEQIEKRVSEAEIALTSFI